MFDIVFIGANRSYAHQNVPSFGVRSSTSTSTKTCTFEQAAFVDADGGT